MTLNLKKAQSGCQENIKKNENVRTQNLSERLSETQEVNLLYMCVTLASTYVHIKNSLEKFCS